MPKQENPNPSPFEFPLVEWESEGKDPSKEARDLQEVRQEMLDIPPHFECSELDGETFVIVAAKPFESSFEGQDHAYFVGCWNEERGKFTTVLGGFLLVETLDQLITAGNTSPLRVTLHEKKQGKFGRYWAFE